MKEFFAMGGYGFYVWMSMGFALFLMLLEPIYLRIQYKSIVKNIQRKIRRESARSKENLS